MPNMRLIRAAIKTAFRHEHTDRQKIEEFWGRKGVRYENQFGFTEGGRVEHCMFMLDYVTNMTYEKRGRKNRSLYIAFIDFKKAYDSIDRKKLIEVLVEYKINPMIIELIVQVYKDDHTTPPRRELE